MACPSPLMTNPLHLALRLAVLARVADLSAAIRAPIAWSNLTASVTAALWASWASSSERGLCTPVCRRASSASSLMPVLPWCTVTKSMRALVSKDNTAIDHGHPCGMEHTLVLAFPRPVAYTATVRRPYK
eukprot:9195006-Alexandrium_andersonii.AAC.1